MGSHITRSIFTEKDEQRFLEKLREETALLKRWANSGALKSDIRFCGLELEAWIADIQGEPQPQCEQFLFHLNNDLVVPELSCFNFEINTVPQPLSGRFLTKIHEALKKTWVQCLEVSESLSLQPVAIGSLPTITSEHLTLKHMSPHQRYYALNEQILRLRKGAPLEVEIKGEEELSVTQSDIMLEAAATSMQIHLQVGYEEAARIFNASQILSAFMVAISSNSPYLFGKNLWAETRIPVFEKAVSVGHFKASDGFDVGRTSLGAGYVKESILELFQENVEKFPVLLPFCTDSDPGDMDHLRLQNGTIWRWNRPLVGFDITGRPHLRMEHRVMAAQPSLLDTVANMALYLGGALALAEMNPSPESQISFQQARDNFYEAAQKGLAAQVHWGRALLPVKVVLKEEILPLAKDKLLSLGVHRDDLEIFFDDILFQRIETAQTGAQWQRQFIKKHGLLFHDMVKEYTRFQKQDLPIHSWTV
ncbi:MAG: hypothetical protein D6797_03235 [Bdellovibrio sp.]|nr:MAG: hypothetical protein D6797_03235 [Bdellovibrio sp.]